jgi:hypothetical protein
MTDEKFDVDALIVERSTTHGDYLLNADITWQIKDALHRGRRYEEMHPAMKETLDMVAHKMHRIVNGDPYFRDHWVDMTGYPHLVVGNWDRLAKWRYDQLLPGAEQISIVRTSDLARATERLEQLLDILRREHGVDVTYQTEDGRPTVRRTMTEAQEAMARDRFSPAPPRPPEAPADSLGGSQAGAEPPLATPTEAGLREAPVSLKIAVTGLSASELAQRIADGGGPIMTAEDEEEPKLPSEVRREPIDATWAEYHAFEREYITHGGAAGERWGLLYQQDADGRYLMHPKWIEEYGR